MSNNFIAFEKVKQLYPDEWVLLGNPLMKNTTVLGGVVLYHSKDKKEVCYIGRDKIGDASKVTHSFYRRFKTTSERIGILRNL